MNGVNERYRLKGIGLQATASTSLTNFNAARVVFDDNRREHVTPLLGRLGDRVDLNPGPYYQQCRSNIVERYKLNDSFDKVECCFDIVAGVDGA